eukprot:617083-Amphidinium_carterae.1
MLCPMGVPVAFFYLARYTLDLLDFDDDMREERLRLLGMQYSVFENYISVFHPGLIEKGNWTILDADAIWLRKKVFRKQLEQSKQEHLPRRKDNVQLVSDDVDIRVYVYDEEDVPELRPLMQGQIYCSRGQWGMDVTIHDFFATCACRTDDPKEADFFFVPG